jgi:PAS domain S-box-containing protein
MNEARVARGRMRFVGATAAFIMSGGTRLHAVTTVGPYAASALAAGAAILAHTPPVQTGVLLFEGATIAILCGAVRASCDRAREHARRAAAARRSSEDAARSAEEARLRLRGVLDESCDLLLLVDDDLVVVDVNRAAAEFFGKSKHELIGSPSSRLVRPQDRIQWVQQWRPRTGPSPHREASLVGPDGAARLFEVTASPNIRPCLHLARLSDIERRRHAEDLAKFLDEASDVLAGSRDGETTLGTVARMAVPRIADWAAIDMLEGHEGLRRVAVAHADRARAELEAELRRLGPRGGDNEAGAGRVVRTGLAEICERIPDRSPTESCMAPDGFAALRSLGFVSAMCVPLRVQGRPVGAMSLACSDERRPFRSADITFAKELAHRASAALENARALRESEEATRVKDEFLATISHELRTPLNAIIGWTTMLRRKPDVDIGKAIHTIERNARAQMRLVEDVLDVSRAATGKLKVVPSEVDLVEVLRASIDVVIPMAEARVVGLDARLDGGPCPFCGDADRLQQAFWNVLSNAIKFTGKGGRVSVRLTRTESRVEVVVADTGRGIDADVLPFVFDRFRQADSSTTRAEGGLGLGLAIVKHIVELHGGTVSAQSRGVGHGATFTMAFPVRAAQAPPASAPGRSLKASSGVYLSSGGLETAQELSGVRVLVCDDDEDARELLAAVLSAEGAAVFTAPSRGEALDAFREWSPHVLLSDVGMPHIDGYELIGQVRALPEEEGGQTPAIALTAYARPEDELKALVAGYQVHVVKPIDPHRLVRMVANLVGRPVQTNRERPGT